MQQLIKKPEAPQQQKQAGAPSQQAANTLLARLVHLAVAALGADSIKKAAAIIVNQIHTLVKTERALIVNLKGQDRIFCISGDLDPPKDNPFSQAVHEIRTAYRDEEESTVISQDTIPADLKAPNARRVLEAMGGTQILWLPIPARGGEERQYALWLERWSNKTWNPEEMKLLGHAGVFFAHALAPRQKPKKKVKKPIAFMAMVLAFLLMWLPMYAQINAPMQIVPDRPYYVFAPFDGIVEELAVEPGEKVDPGDLIFRYDTRVMEKQLEEARQGVAVARAELARLEGAAYDDQEARAKIPVQKLEIERRESQVAFLKKQLELSEVRTDKGGVVVLDEPDALIGASVRTGEMILNIADPERTKAKIMVPVEEAGLLEKGAPAVIRLDSDPLRSIEAKVDHIGFDVVMSDMSDEPMPAVLVEAKWQSDDPDVVPGQRGKARIQGPKTTLGMQMCRKPLRLLRDVFGI